MYRESDPVLPWRRSSPQVREDILMPFPWQISAGLTKGPSGLAPLCYTRIRACGSLDLIPPCCGGSLMSLVSGGVRLRLRPAGRTDRPVSAELALRCPLPPSWTVGTPSFRPPSPQRRGTERVRNTCASVCRADRPSPSDAAWGRREEGLGRRGFHSEEWGFT